MAREKGGRRKRSSPHLLCVTADIKTKMAQNKVVRVVALDVKVPYSLSEIDEGVVLLRCSSLLQNFNVSKLIFYSDYKPPGKQHLRKLSVSP